MKTISLHISEFSMISYVCVYIGTENIQKDIYQIDNHSYLCGVKLGERKKEDSYNVMFGNIQCFKHDIFEI